MNSFRSKVIVRNLPSNCTQVALEEFTIPWSNEINYVHFHKGKNYSPYSAKLPKKARAYLNFATREALLSFVEEVSTRPFVDENGAEHMLHVELAPYQAIPDNFEMQEDGLQGTLEGDEEFLAFVKELLAEEKQALTVDEQVEQTLAKERDLFPWKYQKDVIRKTALLDHLKESGLTHIYQARKEKEVAPVVAAKVEEKEKKKKKKKKKWTLEAPVPKQKTISKDPPVEKKPAFRIMNKATSVDSNATPSTLVQNKKIAKSTVQKSESPPVNDKPKTIKSDKPSSSEASLVAKGIQDLSISQSSIDSGKFGSQDQEEQVIDAKKLIDKMKERLKNNNLSVDTENVKSTIDKQLIGTSSIKTEESESKKSIVETKIEPIQSKKEKDNKIYNSDTGDVSKSFANGPKDQSIPETVASVKNSQSSTHILKTISQEQDSKPTEIVKKDTTIAAALPVSDKTKTNQVEDSGSKVSFVVEGLQDLNTSQGSTDSVKVLSQEQVTEATRLSETVKKQQINDTLKSSEKAEISDKQSIKPKNVNPLIESSQIKQEKVDPETKVAPKSVSKENGNGQKDQNSVENTQSITTDIPKPVPQVNSTKAVKKETTSANSLPVSENPKTMKPESSVLAIDSVKAIFPQEQVIKATRVSEDVKEQQINDTFKSTGKATKPKNINEPIKPSQIKQEKLDTETKFAPKPVSNDNGTVKTDQTSAQSTTDLLKSSLQEQDSKSNKTVKTKPNIDQSKSGDLGIVKGNVQPISVIKEVSKSVAKVRILKSNDTMNLSRLDTTSNGGINKPLPAADVKNIKKPEESNQNDKGKEVSKINITQQNSKALPIETKVGKSTPDVPVKKVYTTQAMSGEKKKQIIDGKSNNSDESLNITKNVKLVSLDKVFYNTKKPEAEPKNETTINKPVLAKTVEKEQKKIPGPNNPRPLYNNPQKPNEPQVVQQNNDSTAQVKKYISGQGKKNSETLIQEPVNTNPTSSVSVPQPVKKPQKLKESQPVNEKLKPVQIKTKPVQQNNDSMAPVNKYTSGQDKTKSESLSQEPVNTNPASGAPVPKKVIKSIKEAEEVKKPVATFKPDAKDIVVKTNEKTAANAKEPTLIPLQQSTTDQPLFFIDKMPQQSSAHSVGELRNFSILTSTLPASINLKENDVDVKAENSRQ